jgi:hypothetical protein
MLISQSINQSVNQVDGGFTALAGASGLFESLHRLSPQRSAFSCVCVCVYVCVYIYIYMCVYMYVCVCMYVCMCVCIYISSAEQNVRKCITVNSVTYLSTDRLIAS